MKTKHIYRGEKTKIHKIFFKRNVKSDEPQSIVEFDITIPIDTPVTTNYQEFVVNSKIIVRFGSNGIKMKREINVHSSITDPLIMRERSKSIGFERDFNENIPFNGAHSIPPPHYQEITDIDLPIGIEKVKTIEGKQYYVSHFTRTTSYTPDMKTECEYPYPFYQFVQLPSGWAMGTDLEEIYFIDHNTQTTQWEDPRPFEQRIIPHIQSNLDATFEIELITYRH